MYINIYNVEGIAIPHVLVELLLVVNVIVTNYFQGIERKCSISSSYTTSNISVWTECIERGYFREKKKKCATKA